MTINASERRMPFRISAPEPRAHAPRGGKMRRPHEQPCSASCVLILLALPTAAFAQRRVTWDSINVHATLDRDGMLIVEEEQAMVFTGEWNGGERRFNIRPRQRLAFVDIARESGGQWQTLREDADLDDVDEFAFTDRHRLRWRSRLASDVPFDGQIIKYRLRYRLSGILVARGEGFLLDHDFLFPDREGTIDRFELRLSLDPAWTPEGEIRETVHGRERCARPGLRRHGAVALQRHRCPGHSRHLEAARGGTGDAGVARPQRARPRGVLRP